MHLKYRANDTCVICFSPVFQIRTKWIPLVNGDAEKGNKYVSAVDGCVYVCILTDLLNFALILFQPFACSD